MKKSIETIRKGLAGELAELDRELEAIRCRADQLKSERRSISAALKALGADGSSNGGKPAPKKSQVAVAVRDLLAANKTGVDEQDLEPLVAEKLDKDHNCSAVGLALRLREVLAADEFVISSGSIRLANTTKPASGGTTS